MQRALHVLVGCIFRQVDTYIQPQENDGLGTANYRLLLRQAFAKLVVHIFEINTPFRTVRTFLFSSGTEWNESAQTLLSLYFDVVAVGLAMWVTSSLFPIQI